MPAAGQTPPPSKSDPLYPIAQAADYLGGRGLRFARRLVHERRIPIVRIGGRVFIRKSALDAFLAANTQPAERSGPTRIPPPKPRKLTTEAAPNHRTVYAEPPARITPAAKSAETGKTGKDTR